MRPYDPDQPLIYTHIPKCAGSSIVHVLARWFREGYHKLNQDESKDILIPRIPTKDGEGNWLQDVKCIHAHFNHGRGYGLPYYYPEINQYFTIIRDPFDVAVSMYFFAKKNSREGNYWFRGQRVDILEEFPNVESYVRQYPYWIFEHLPVDIDLSNYQRKLAEKFIYIGIYEDLEFSIVQLAKILNKKVFPIPHLNSSAYDEPVPEKLRQKFYDDNPLLKKIYDFALAHYKRIS